MHKTLYGRKYAMILNGNIFQLFKELYILHR
jgi:hypothetical protein